LKLKLNKSRVKLLTQERVFVIALIERLCSQHGIYHTVSQLVLSVLKLTAQWNMILNISREMLEWRII